MPPIRPRRSCLYMPGSNARALDKARSLPADMVVFDLEDAVAPDAKPEARAQVADAVRQGGYDPREVIVRINGLETEWGEADLAAAVQAGPDGVLAPKISSAAQVDELDEALSAAGASPEMGLWAMIETPMALLNLAAIAETAADTRLAGFVVGTNDLAKELRAEMTADRAAFVPHLATILAAARAYGLVVLDGVFNDIPNEDGLRAECLQGRALGFDGKTLIHPKQVDICNAVFAPDADALAHARDVVAAFDAPENAGKGVIKVNGKMTELLHLEDAHRLIAMDAAIQAALSTV